MYKIISNKNIINNIYILEVEAPLIAKKIKPGEFVIIMTKQRSERIPMAVMDTSDTIIKILYAVKGSSTHELSLENNNIYSITGPLGKKSILINEEYKEKNILLIGMGTGISQVYFLAKYLFTNFNKKCDVVFYINNELESDPFILNNLEKYSNLKVTLNIKNELIRISNYDIALVVGNIKDMEMVSLELTKKNIKTLISLAPLMLDGIGLCGSCRIMVNGTNKFACLDGPEFFSNEINFKEATARMNIYKEEELEKLLIDRSE